MSNLTQEPLENVQHPKTHKELKDTKKCIKYPKQSFLQNSLKFSKYSIKTITVPIYIRINTRSQRTTYFLPLTIILNASTLILYISIQPTVKQLWFTLYNFNGTLSILLLLFPPVLRSETLNLRQGEMCSIIFTSPRRDESWKHQKSQGCRAVCINNSVWNAMVLLNEISNIKHKIYRHWWACVIDGNRWIIGIVPGHVFN